MKNLHFVTILFFASFALAENPHDFKSSNSDNRPVAEDSELSPFVPVNEESVGIIQEGVDNLQQHFIDTSGTRMGIATFEESQSVSRL